MPWKLEIHHIDVGQGESTLIVVRRNGAIQKTALIDGGLLGVGTDIVRPYLISKGIANLDLVICSHYDKDHVNGLRSILGSSNLCTNTRVYDRGEQGNVDQFGNITNQVDIYKRYIEAISESNGRTRPTATIKNNAPANWKAGDWLLGKELFRFPSNLAGAPTLTCIAANQYVYRRPTASGANNLFVFGGLSDDLENRLSLAFELKFYGFRYYTGGDIETNYESSIAQYLNSNNNNAGHVCAFKASHHGSENSTDIGFVNKLRSSAAFISCGAVNTFDHPRQVVIDNLQAQATMQNYYLTACGYLRTHIRQAGVVQTGKSRVAGDLTHGGHIVLNVTEAGARATPHQFTVTYWEEGNNMGAGGNETITHTCV